MHEQETDSIVAEANKKTADAPAKELPAPVAVKKVGPIQFFREVQRETSKVTWPTWKETWVTTLMVFIMVGLTMVFFFVVDFAFQMGQRWLVGALG
jgi:preprotein translocase subunit SecE